jgi:hypothetical protein
MRQVALLVAVVCIFAAPVVTAGSTTGPAAQAAPSQEDVTQEGVDITIELQPDGDAHWNISARYALEDANDSAAFTRLAERFKARETDNGFSLDVFESVVPEVSEQVGRPMEIRANNPRTARTIDHGNNSTGVLSLEFTWTNFTRVSGDQYIVDSFTGTWFGDLERGQTLTIQPPEGFEKGEQVQPEATVESGGYQWTGPQHFDSGQPSVVFTESTGTEERPFDISLLTLFGVGGLALVVGGILVWAYQYTGRGDEVTDDGEPVPESTHSTNGGPTAEQTAAVGSGGDQPSGGGAAVDSELLSDEERVEQLLEENGGRMKQAKIVEETRWSNAKVSQLLSAMADEGRVEKLRIGRENLISLPGEGVNDEQ